MAHADSVPLGVTTEGVQFAHTVFAGTSLATGSQFRLAPIREGRTVSTAAIAKLDANAVPTGIAAEVVLVTNAFFTTASFASRSV